MAFKKLKEDIQRMLSEQSRPKVTPQTRVVNGAKITNSVPLNRPVVMKQTSGLMQTNTGQNASKFLNKAAPAVTKFIGNAVVNPVARKVIKEYVVQPTVRAFVEGGKTLAGQMQPEYAKPGIGQYLMGKEPIRHYKDPGRPGQQFANKLGKPALAMPLILGGAALDAVPIGVDDVIRNVGKKGGPKVAEKVGKELIKDPATGIIRTKIRNDLAKKILSGSEEPVFFGNLSQAKLEAINRIRKSQGIEQIMDGSVYVYPNVLKKLLEKRVRIDKMSPDQVADMAYSAIHNKKSKVLSSKYPQIQALIRSGEISNLAFVGKSPNADVSLKSVYKNRTESLPRTLSKEKTPTKIASNIGGSFESSSKESIPSLGKGVKSPVIDSNEEKSLFDAVDNVYSAIVKDPTKKTTSKNLDNLTKSLKGKDLSSFRHTWSDVFRNFRQVFGKDADNYGAKFLQKFDDAKRPYIDDVTNWAGALDTNIVKGLGIKPKSKLSGLVQKYGEKLITIDELKRRAPKDWEKVVQADQWFRTQYDDLIEQVNATRKSIYPNSPEKLIPKRADYYRHFKEFAEGYKGLINVFDTPAQIPAELVGISDITKPFTKYLPFAQKRLGNKTEYDAVTGFVDYVKSAAYAKNIDPQVKGFYELADELRGLTSTGADSKMVGSANNFIEFLEDFARNLSGKTNPLDRGVQKFTGRKLFKVVDWVNNRVKVNMVLGNISSAINQTASIPNAIADAGPVNSVKAIGGIVNSIVGDGIKPRQVSTFVGERYLDEVFEPFETGMLKYPKRLAKWLLTTGDKMTVNFTFQAEYQKALSKGLTDKDAINFAQNATRNVVAGRGIGEVPLGQKSKVIQFVAPFQLEVANQWLMAKDWIDEKTFGKFVTLALTAHVFNEASERVSGNRILPDPLEYLEQGIKAYEEEGGGKEGGFKLGMRILGGYASTFPGATNIAGFFPEKTRQEYFGSLDPGRFGSGSPLTKAIKKTSQGISEGSAANLITYIGLPFGGAQVRKTKGGIDAVTQGGMMNDRGELSFPLNDNTAAKIQALVFGQYANPNARLFFDRDLYRLSQKETAQWNYAVSKGADPVVTWKALQRNKISQSLPNRIRTVMEDSSMSVQDKQKEVEGLMREYKFVMEELQGDTVDFSVESKVEDTTTTNPNPTKQPIVSGRSKKAKKPAAPKTPALQQKSYIKSGSYSSKHPDLAYDITFLEERGVMPKFNFQ